MKKTTTPCFSNGTEYSLWLGRNCDNCIKAPKLHMDEDGDWYSQSRCRIRDEIDEQALVGDHPVSMRVYNITQKQFCPFIKTQWPKRKKKDKDKSLSIDFGEE